MWPILVCGALFVLPPWSTEADRPLSFANFNDVGVVQVGLFPISIASL